MCERTVEENVQETICEEQLMELLDNKKKEFVRIRIGSCITGYTGLKKPIKTINVQNTSVQEVYDKILEAIKNE